MNAIVPGGKRCSGTLSDYDRYTCQSGARLTLSLPMCNNGEDSLYGKTCLKLANKPPSDLLLYGNKDLSLDCNLHTQELFSHYIIKSKRLLN